MRAHGRQRRRPTAADVALRAGVSLATVSQVLGQTGRISAATRERVLRVISELGYVYHQGAASLRTSTTRTVGLLVHDIGNPFYAEMTAGVTEALEACGYLVFLANSAESIERQALFLDALRRHNVAGCLICPARGTTAAALACLNEWALPTVVAVRPVQEAMIDFVGVDNAAGTREATRHLIAQGHERIAFLGGERRSTSRGERFAGYRASMHAHGLATPDAFDIACAASLAAGRDALRALLAAQPSVSAVVCYHDIVALGALIELQNSNRKAGPDFGIVGFDDIAAARLWSPTLTTVSPMPRGLGFAAGERLVRRIEQRETLLQTVRLEARLIVRESSLR